MKPFSLPDIYPVMGEFRSKYYLKLDLSGLRFANPEAVQPGLLDYIHTQRGSSGTNTFPFGGYLEKRNFYTASTLFNTPQENRNIHLGIDVWANAGAPVYASLDGHIHSFAYNDGHLDYGATIIVQYDDYFVLYGHLSRKSLLGIYPGKPVYKSAAIAELGDMTENGGWVPHLHIQLIRDIGTFKGDYPGLCSEEMLEYYVINCPDPEFLVIP